MAKIVNKEENGEKISIINFLSIKLISIFFLIIGILMILNEYFNFNNRPIENTSVGGAILFFGFFILIALIVLPKKIIIKSNNISKRLYWVGPFFTKAEFDLLKYNLIASNKKFGIFNGKTEYLLFLKANKLVNLSGFPLRSSEVNRGFNALFKEDLIELARFHNLKIIFEENTKKLF